jgi:hypothetical protein
MDKLKALLSSKGGGEDGAPKPPTVEECSALKQPQKEMLAGIDIKKETTDRLNSGLNTLDWEKSVAKIIKTICQTIQKEKIKDITVDMLENMRTAILEYSKKPEVKTYIEESFIKATPPKDDTSSGEQKDNGQFLWNPNDDETDMPNIELSEIKDLTAQKLLDYFTEGICVYIKKNPASVGPLITSINKRFGKFFSDSPDGNLKTVLQPISEEVGRRIRDLVKTDAKGEQLLVNYLQIPPTELPELQNPEKKAKIEEKRKSMFKSYIIKKKFTPSVVSSSCPAQQSDLAALSEELLKKGGSKTKINKNILRRHKTLKRKLKL